MERRPLQDGIHNPMGHILLSSHALWPKKCWSHLPACHDALLPWYRAHHVGLFWQPHRAVAKPHTTHRWLATSPNAMSLVQDPLQPIQVCFLCPHGPYPRIHHVTQRNDCWSWESPNDFPPNVTPLSDNILNCIIVFPFFVLHIFPNWVLCIISSHCFRWSTPQIGIWDSQMEKADGTCYHLSCT